MERKNIKINSNSDGLVIDICMFVPDGEIKGIFQIAHGMAEHKERYFKFMEFLANNGYLSIINDHRGHGKSVKDKEDLGYFYDNSGESIVDDLLQVTNYVKTLYPNKKVILFGHSMGSMVVRSYIKKYDSNIDSLIVCGSPSKNSLAKVGLFITKLIGLFKGQKYRSSFVDWLVFNETNKKFLDENEKFAWVSSNKEVIKEYNNDSLCGFSFTINGFINLFKLMINIYDKSNWKLSNTKLPILFIAGSDDPIIVSEKKWIESQKFLKELGYLNIDNKLYYGMRHELLNEIDNQLVYDDIVQFLNKN